MEGFAELTWFAAYLVQMIALLVGVGLVMVVGVAALYDIVRCKAGERRLSEPLVALRENAEGF